MSASPRKEQQVLARFRLTPTAALDDDRASRRRRKTAPRVRQRRGTPASTALPLKAEISDLVAEPSAQSRRTRPPSAPKNTAHPRGVSGNWRLCRQASGRVRQSGCPPSACRSRAQSSHLRTADPLSRTVGIGRAQPRHRWRQRAPAGAGTRRSPRATGARLHAMTARLSPRPIGAIATRADPSSESA